MNRNWSFLKKCGELLVIGVITSVLIAGCGGGGGGGTTSTIASIPGAPTAVTATAGNASARVSFTAPTNNGGASITGYTVTSSPGNIQASGAASPITVTGLNNGTAYTFTVFATNSVGNSVASTVSNSVTPALPTGASAAGTVVANYIADSESGSFVGDWTNAVTIPTASAQAYAETLAATTTANTYTLSSSSMNLVAGVWGAASATFTTSYLTTAGWLPETGITAKTAMDSGDGIHGTYNIVFGTTAVLSTTYALAQTDLSGTTITCKNPARNVITCATPGSYPAGASQYTLTPQSNLYRLQSGGTKTAVTDASGAPLTALPALTTTFCDNDIVLQPMAVPTATANYSYFGITATGGCTGSNITAALGTAALGTVLISNQTTGNTNAPNVLVGSGWTGPFSLVSTSGYNWLWGVLNGNVWDGYMDSAGIAISPSLHENQIAIDAELTANNLTPLGGAGSVVSIAGSVSYIADALNGNFVGSWYSTGTGTAEAFPATLATTATVNTYTYTFGDTLLGSGTWSTNSSPSMTYDLISTGWIPTPSTGTMVDSGDGLNMTFTPAGEPSYVDSVTQASLAGTTIPCDTGTCSGASTYPAGAVSYTHTEGGTSTYTLWGATPLTGATGSALTALPAIGSTFCDPDDLLVFQAISPAPASGNNYNVFNTASCGSADITAALGTAVADTVLISTQATGSSAVPTVLLLSGTTNVTWMEGAIYGLRAGNVWAGNANLVGWTWSDENKIAINAELVYNGLTAIP
jgi:hypothetical protein